MPFIEEIAIANPKFCHKQEDILKFMQSVAPESEHRKLKMIYQKSEIKTRYSVIPDYSTQKRTFYPSSRDLEPFPTVEARMKLFEKEALALCLSAVSKIQKKTNITHLITVTCTGLSAPGLDIALIKKLNLPTDIIRTSVNFMGCYAGFHALRLADSFCKSQKDAKVLIVDVELCTIHFQKTATEDNFLANALFADGASAVIVSNNNQNSHFELKGFHTELALEGEQSMAWQVASTGFLMTLNSYVPKFLTSNIDKLIAKSFEKNRLNFLQIHHWAIHPGGSRILESIEKKLELKKVQLESSYKVLSEYGNMSSATIFFVLKELESLVMKDENIFACGFGPGLTMESLVLKGL
jgi:predicted naringenin-chalcone synthase